MISIPYIFDVCRLKFSSLDLGFIFSIMEVCKERFFSINWMMLLDYFLLVIFVYFFSWGLSVLFEEEKDSLRLECDWCGSIKGPNECPYFPC